MGRTRAAGNNAANAVRDGATYRAGAGENRAARSAPASGPRHILGISAVVAVFALVGLTLWQPLSVLITVPVIAVLALIVRTAVPVPAVGRSGAGAGARRPASQGRGSATRPRGSSTGSATGPRDSSTGPREVARRPAGSSRYDDRPPYDQEADPAATSVARRPARPAAARYERDDARRHRQPELQTPPRRSATGPGAARYGDRDDNRRTPAEDPRYAGSRDREAARDRARDRQPGAADYPAYGAAGPRAASGRDGYDDRVPAGQDARHPAPQASSTGPRYPRDAADEWRGHPGVGPERGTPGAGDRRDPQDEYDGHDEYGNELYASDRGDSRAVQAGRWRGWRQPDWDDDTEPEPEPDEDMMHTMALDMRGYLDDTGSFRMP